MAPFLSVITINLNNAIGLRKTIESVLSQKFLNFEFIVIDGASTDGSKELLSGYCDRLSFYVSEKDTGIYNAMNKGINAAKGEYLQFLNSGDALANENILEYIFGSINDTNGFFDFYYTDVINQQTKNIQNYPQKLTFKHFFELTINHQATFFKRDLFQKFGNYSEEYRIVSDWEFYMKILFLHNATYLHLSKPSIFFDFSNGISTSSVFIQIMNEERQNVLKKYFANIIDDYNYLKTIETSNTWKALQKINKLKRYLKINIK